MPRGSTFTGPTWTGPERRGTARGPSLWRRPGVVRALAEAKRAGRPLTLDARRRRGAVARHPMKLTYAVVFEQTPNNYCASVADVPGCVGAADSRDEMRAMIREALAFHIEDLLERANPSPSRSCPSTRRSPTTTNPSPRMSSGRSPSTATTPPYSRRGSNSWRSRSRPRRRRRRDDTGARRSSRRLAGRAPWGCVVYPERASQAHGR